MVVVVGVLTAGCGEDEASCEDLGGRFAATYTQLSGSCGEIEDPPDVPVVEINLAAVVEMIGDAEIQTEIVASGCRVRLVQTIRTRPPDRPVQVRSRIEGFDLTVVSETEVRGEVSYERFAEGPVRPCEGTYAVVLRKAAPPTAGAP